MQTHEDSDQIGGGQFMKRLKERATNMVGTHASEITAGAPGEPVLGEWIAEGIGVVRRPNDPQNVLRISVGGGMAGMNYCVFRGNRLACIDLLERAAEAMKNEPDSKRGDDSP